MTNVTEIEHLGVHLSMSALSRELGMTRETIANRLRAAKVEPSGTKDGYPVYRLKDALRALLHTTEDGEVDPDKLTPFERKAYYQAATEKLRYLTETGELIPRIEVEQTMARFIKVIVQGLETLPDVFERDCGATPAMLVKSEKEIDRLRDHLYTELMETMDATGAAGQG